MFKLVSMIAVAAATSTAATANADEKKAKDQLDKSYKDAKDAITGSSKILHSNFTMPHANGVVPTFADINTDTDAVKYCAQCVFSGSDFQVATTTAKAKCTVPAAKVTALDAADKTKKTAVPATVHEELTYKDLFDGLETCAGEVPKATTSFTYQNGALITSGTPVCTAAYDETTFVAGKPTGKKDQTNQGTVKYSWTHQDSNTEGDWCFIKTYLPTKYSGGLILTHHNNADTKVAIRVNNAINRYFNNDALKAMSIGKTGQIPLAGANSIGIFMTQADKQTTTAAADDFSVTFTRATYLKIAEMTALHGGVIVWVIIGVVIVCLIITLICLWKKCAHKKDEEDRFYQEDSYMRV